ncbi:MAG: hypothetical protein ACIAS6_10680 [Phycisphaerales bacterium JB060]
MSTALVSRVGRTEQAIDWALAVVNTSERHIESVMLNITYRGRRTVVNAVPFGKTIPPGVSIDVIISLPAPIGPEQDFEVEGTVTAVRFSDGQTMGDVNVLPHHEPTQPPKEPPFEGARLTPMSWPLQREEISLVRAEFSWGDGPSEDVTEAVEQWMVDPAWPTPLTVYPQALGLETKAQPHEKDRLTIFLIVGPSSKRIDVPVGQTLHVGGPTTLGSEPLVAREPVVVDGFRLVSAYFGGDDEWRDAMPGLAEIAARDGRIDTSVGEHLIGGEALRWPYPLLRLYFEYDGARWEARINEGESLQIPPSE